LIITKVEIDFYHAIEACVARYSRHYHSLMLLKRICLWPTSPQFVWLWSSFVPSW